MKTFQIIDGKCHWDATAQFPTVGSTSGCFPPDDLFVEAPDYVREGWGYADGKFAEPEPPAPGLVYDRETGMFYNPNPEPAPEPEPEPEPTEAGDTAAMLVDHEYRLTLLELGLSEGGEV